MACGESLAQSGQANLPLGMFPSVRYDQGEVRVQTGDRFLLTDSLSEAMSPESDEEFGETELPALPEAEGNDDLAGLRHTLVAGVKAFSGCSLLKDDCTLMVVEVR